ncbi:MAG: hypothetical protein K2L18_12715, partial [Acetatifactor sp.]|nr:hypothetical protein [Acetatifactor sp.]
MPFYAGSVGFVTVFYINQLNKAISENIIRLISEIAEHDKAVIQAYIDCCGKDLYGIQDRFIIHRCETIQDIEIRM